MGYTDVLWIRMQSVYNVYLYAYTVRYTTAYIWLFYYIIMYVVVICFDFLFIFFINYLFLLFKSIVVGTGVQLLQILREH